MATLFGVRLTDTYTSAELTARGFAAGVVHEEYDGKKYKLYLYNSGAGSVAAAAGNVAYIYAPGGTSAGATTTITSDLSDSNEIGAGVLQAVIASGSYGWVQVSGPATLTTALTAGADGDPLTPSGSTDGTLDVVASVTDPVCAYAIDASAKIVMCNFAH
jgi:hypothetical protein